MPQSHSRSNNILCPVLHPKSPIKITFLGRNSWMQSIFRATVWLGHSCSRVLNQAQHHHVWIYAIIYSNYVHCTSIPIQRSKGTKWNLDTLLQLLYAVFAIEAVPFMIAQSCLHIPRPFSKVCTHCKSNWSFSSEIILFSFTYSLYIFYVSNCIDTWR